MVLGIGVFFLVQSEPTALASLVPSVIPALPAVLLGLGGVLVGLLFGIRRFLSYAALLFLSGAVGALLRAKPGWHLLVPGGVILIVGLMILVSFLRKHSLAEVEGVS